MLSNLWFLHLFSRTILSVMCFVSSPAERTYTFMMFYPIPEMVPGVGSRRWSWCSSN